MFTPLEHDLLAANAERLMEKHPPREVTRRLPIADRAAYGESSGSSRANRTFHGHTSWHVWPFTRFEMLLITGGRTLRKATG